MNEKEIWVLIQKKLALTADGIAGINTAKAVAKVLGINLPLQSVHNMHSEKEVRSNNSCFGVAGDENNLVNVVPAYQLYYDGTPVKSIRVHRLIKDNVLRIFEKTLKHYGIDAIKRLKLDIYDGSFSNRSVRSGSLKSMHAWGIAIDMCASHNGNSVSRPKALFSGAEYVDFWNIVRSEGGYSMGEICDRDYMHFQFAKI